MVRLLPEAAILYRQLWCFRVVLFCVVFIASRFHFPVIPGASPPDFDFRTILSPAEESRLDQIGKKPTCYSLRRIKTEVETDYALLIRVQNGVELRPELVFNFGDYLRMRLDRNDHVPIVDCLLLHVLLFDLQVFRIRVFEDLVDRFDLI